jgi:hypothetical protein
MIKVHPKKGVFVYNNKAYDIITINDILNIKQRIQIVEMMIEELNAIRERDPKFMNIDKEQFTVYDIEDVPTVCALLTDLLEHVSIHVDSDLSTNFIDYEFS